MEIPELDQIDRRIIGALARDGRMTFVRLGELIGLSASATTERVRRLERLGVISGYHAHIDSRVIGRPLVALVDVKLASGSFSEAFEQTLGRIGAIREHIFVTGRYDYQLLVTCRDAANLDQVLRILREEPAVSETETRVVLRGPSRNRVSATA